MDPSVKEPSHIIAINAASPAAGGWSGILHWIQAKRLQSAIGNRGPWVLRLHKTR